MAAPLLSIGTSTERIQLLNPHGFTLTGWGIDSTTLEAIFQESKLADFRQMAAYRDITVHESLDLTLAARTPDHAADDLRGLRAMLRLVADYWTTTWQTSVVYLSARANRETETRHCVIHDGRLVGEGNPYGQPFLQRNGSVIMDELSLIVERGPWLENAPGTGTCVEISSQAADNQSFILNFETGDDVDCGSGASVDDLPDGGDLTVETWVYADDSLTTFNFLFFKGNGWAFGIGYAGVIYTSDFEAAIFAHAAYNVTSARTEVLRDTFAFDNDWHHVAAVWDQSALRWDIAVDGEWVATTVQAGAGAYVVDAPVALVMGNGTRDMKTSWSRISDSLRYTVGHDFTSPDRCTCPTVDGNTVGLWCLAEGTGATAFDETANNNDGTITGAEWGWSGCEKEYMAATCNAQSVFIANKHNVAQLTHVRWWDESGGAWNAGGNLIGAATPFALFQAAPAVDDFALFGINTALADSGPFSSLVFDISTAIGAGATLEWRYKGTVGADTDDPQTWTALTVQDNTDQVGAMTGDPFDTEGIGSVHWEQPADWVTSNPNPGVLLGVTGYWIACYVTAGPAANAPEQDNRDVYTVTWPYIEFASTEITGDMPALLRLSVDARSAQDGVATTTNLWCQRVIAGLRSMDRGDDFTAYVNISDEQNGPAITITLDAGMGAFAALATAPTGRASLYTAAGVDAMAVRVRIRLGPDWYGRFHAFVRGRQVTGAAGIVDVRLGYLPSGSAYPATQYTVTRQFLNTADDQLLDFGEILMGTAADVFPLEVSHTYIEIEAGTSAAATAYFYELILIPIDEWAIDAEDVTKNTGALGYTNDYWSHWEGDGIRNQRKLLSYLMGTASGKIARYWRPITNGVPILQTGKQQRLWFLESRNDDYADVDDQRADSEICSTIQIWKQQRYTTLRGDK